MYGNKMMEELRQNQKADVVSEHIVQGMLYSLLLASVQCVLKVPDHSRRSERTGSLHECIDILHEGVDSLHAACMNAWTAAKFRLTYI